MMLTEEIKKDVEKYFALANLVKELGSQISQSLEDIEPGFGFNEEVFEWISDVEDQQFDSAAQAISELESILEEVAMELD